VFFLSLGQLGLFGRGKSFLHCSLSCSQYHDSLHVAVGPHQDVVNPSFVFFSLDSVFPLPSQTTASLNSSLTPCGEGTVVSIISYRCAYCCPELIHGKIIWHRSSYFVVAICYVQNCELSYNVLGMTENCKHTEWIYYRTGCGIWLVGGKGDNVIMNNW